MAHELPQALPRYMMLKITIDRTMHYMRYTHEDIQQHGLIQFADEPAASPYVKLEVEPSTTVRGLVHIRSCYNNKYWVRWSGTYNNFIAAAADSPDEDRSKISCTLFRPVFVDLVDNNYGTKNLLIRLVHVQLNMYTYPVGMYQVARFLYAGGRNPFPNRGDAYEVVDWESLVVMPRHVAFKGENNMFLRARVIERSNYLEFSATDNGDVAGGHEVFPNPDGSVRIRSNHYGRFWRVRPDRWVLADSADQTSNDSNTVFWPVKAGPTQVALRSQGNSRFCKRFTDAGKTSCLSAVETSIDKFARMEVQERVISRSIYNVDFRLLDARIYNETVRTMAGTEVLNDSPNPNPANLKLTYTDTTTRSWQSSVAFSYGVTSTISTGIPVIAEGTIEVSWSLSAEYAWGQTHESSQEVEAEYNVTVSPYSKATVRLLATQGSCDVPFSYTQRDILFDGRHVVTRMHDGIFKGANFYNFHWANTEQKLTAEEINLAQLGEEEKKKKLITDEVVVVEEEDKEKLITKEDEDKDEEIKKLDKEE